ncbi:hypothetical protein QA089_005545 [Meyerozyma guilliermondii]
MHPRAPRYQIGKTIFLYLYQSPQVNFYATTTYACLVTTAERVNTIAMSSVLIVGCGVMGLSSAIALAERGHKVVAMDSFPVPSPWSAACDFNKIIRTEYTDKLYTELSVAALDEWRHSPVYNHTFKECGRILITPENHEGRREFERLSIANLQAIGGGKYIEYYKGGEQLGGKFKVLSHNSVKDSTEIKWNPESGLAHAANALRSAHARAEQLGVTFVFGDAGRVVATYTENGTVYVISADGSKRTADQVLLSAGAATGYLVDLGQQQSATGLFITHIKLTPQEYEKYKDIPVVFDGEMGYFFPPDPATYVLKIALPGSGTSNYVNDPFGVYDKKSLPRYKNDNPNDTVPLDGYDQARRLLPKYVPDLAHHKLRDSKVCWIADTSDSHFIVDAVPKLPNLFVATGDSGHAFKFLPTIGDLIADKLEGKLAEKYQNAWKWRDNISPFDPTDCSWRVVSEPLDISQVKWAKEDSHGTVKL